MRFSYIDSKGKEIEVDSVESLALRIEVGAIQPETEMYDAVADRWAPAEEHPVYRSLARGEEVTEEDIVPIGADEEDTLTAAATAEAEAPPVPAAEPEAAPEPEPEPPASEPESAPEPEVAEPLADETASAEAAAAPEAPRGGSGDDPLGLDFSVTQSESAESADDAVEIEDLAPPESEPEPAVTSGPPPPPLPEEEPSPEPEAADDDELPYLEEEEEGEVTAEEEEAGAPAGGYEDFGDVDLEEPTTSGPPLPPEMEDAEAGSDQWAGAEAEADVWGDVGGADAEPPVVPDDDPDARRLPAWARDAEPWEGGAASPSNVVRAEEEEAQLKRDAEETRRNAPRPAHWGAGRLEATRKRRRRLQIAGLGVVLLGILAGVGYVTGVGEVLGIGGGAEGNGEEVVPLSAGAVALKNAALTAAYAAALDDVRADLSNADVPSRPPEEWLQGIYFASAGDYPGVAAYWEAVAGTIEAARGRLASSFRGELRSQLDAGTGPSGRVGPDERERIEEEAMADWEGTAPARDSVFTTFLALAGSSLELHVLLVENEDEIAYEPFSSPGVSRDPILEAVPDDPELKAEMDEHLDAVFGAMSDTRVPRPITSEGILSLLVPALEGIGPGS